MDKSFRMIHKLLTFHLPNNLMSRVFFKLPIIHNKAPLRAGLNILQSSLSSSRDLFNPRDICSAFVLSLCAINDVTSLNFKIEAKYEIKRQIGREDTLSVILTGFVNQRHTVNTLQLPVTNDDCSIVIISIVSNC